MPEDMRSPAPTLLDLMRQRAERYRDKVAFDYCHYSAGGAAPAEVHTRLTYHELDIKARAIASTLQRQGAAGERVLVLCPSGLDFIAGFFGCIYAGAVAVPVHPPVHSRVIGRVASIVADAQAGLVLTTAELQAELKAVVDDLADGRSLRWCAVDAVAPAAAAEWVVPDVDAAATALVQYTSGSTSSLKGVTVTHRSLLHNLDAICRAWGRGHEDAIGVFWLPLHHDMGLIGSILEALYVGCTIFLMPPEAFIERPMRWLEALSRHRGTITAAPNFAYELCVERSSAEERAALDLSNWTMAMCGAEPVRVATLQRFADAFRPAGFRPEAFNPVYGLAEATLLVSGASDWAVPVVRHVDGVALREHRVVNVAPEHPAATPFVGCGRAQRGHEIVIVDPATRRPCAAGEVGEIWHAGGSVAQGYWGRPAETEETFSAFLASTGADTGRGPFLRTGDLGFQLEGELFVTGRLKDLIVIRGRNYYPEDIEAAVQDSHPALLRGRGAAFSVTAQSSPAEQLVVVQEVDRNRIRDLDDSEVVSEVIDAIRTAITEHHQIQPYAIVLVEPSRIPTTSSGKIRRSRCRQRFVDGDLEVFAQWHAPSPPDPRLGARPGDAAPGGEGCGAGEIADWIVSQLAQQLGLSPTEVDTSLPFAHYGLDSIHAIRLTAALEAWLGRELSPTLAYEHPTIDLLSKHLAEDARAEEPDADERPVVAAETGGPANPHEPIAIIGIGCRFPGADGPAAFWRLLSDGVDAVTVVPPDRWDADAAETATTTATTRVDGGDPPRPDSPRVRSPRWGGFLDQVDQFDPQFFGISPREAARMDPQQRLLLEVAWEAMEDAGQVPDRLTGGRTGVFIGVSTNDYATLQSGQPDHIDAYSGTGNALSIAANRLSYFFDFRGPSMAVDTACSSSLVAIHLACRSLREGECTLAVAGGVNVILSPALGINFSKAGVMAADGRCKVFDARADGYVRGEGAGIVVLKPLSRALADGDPIYAVIRGSAINQDGRTNGLMAPSRGSQEAVLAEAYRCAELSPGAVDYVEAHGTGTSLGDAIEAKALVTTLAEGRPPGSSCLVGSVKTNIGHLEAAAGVAGLIKVALALRHRAIPPSLHFAEPNPLIPFDSLPLRVAQTLTPWPENGRRAVAGVSSFGFGGANAHVVLTEAPQVRITQPADDTAEDRVELLPLSARSPEALAALAGRYQLALAAGLPLADLCYTAGARRGHYDHRLAVVGDSPAELSASLAAYRQEVPRSGLSAGRCRPGQRPGVVFLFSGQGSQWYGMGRLHAEEPVFRDALTRCDDAMRPHLDGALERSIVAELFADHVQSRRSDVGMVQPAIFAVQVALAALWRSWGVEPEAVVGHSMGEVAAAHVAGALSLEDAAQVICERARLLRRADGRGAMVAAELSVAEAQDLIAGQQSRVAVAACNSHRSTVLSGDPAVLTDLVTALQRRGRFCRWVEVDVASHSPQMNALRADLTDALAGLRPSAPTTPMYSTVTSDLLGSGSPAGDLDAAYWVENLCSPVRFSAAVRRLLDLGRDTFLEVSPHPILLSAVREDAEDLGRTCSLLPSMRRDDPGRATMLTSLGALYTRGQPVAWDQLHPQGGRCVAAPTYPWQRDRFWLDDTTSSNGLARPVASDRPAWRGPLRSSVHPQTMFTEIEVGTELMPELADHRVQGSVVIPAATLLELVSAGVVRAFGPASRLLRDVVLHRSLVLADAQRRTVQFVLQGEPPGPVSFECYGLEPGASGSAGSSGWMLLASGTVDTGEADARIDADNERHRPEVIRARCPDTIPGPSFYRLLAEHGLQYGPGFQAVVEIWRRDGEAIARLTPPVAGSSMGQVFQAGDFDAAVLDGCFQVLAATLPLGFSGTPDNGDSRDTYLPVGVSELRNHGMARGGMWCHALLRTGLDPEPDTIEGDVFLLREDGRVAVAVRGLRLQRIPDAGPARPATAATNLRDSLYELRWQPALLGASDHDAPSRSVDAGSWLIFGDGSTTSDTLRELLQQHSQMCVFVEPGSDFVRVGPDNYRLDPAQPQHFRQLLEEAFGAMRPPCRGVVHLWSLLAAPPAETSTDSLESARTLGTASVLHLVQAMTKSGWPDAPRLWLVTRAAQAVGTDVEAVSIAQAPLWGMGRSIDHEHPELRCSRIDLASGGGPDELEALVQELLADSPEADVALRGGRRYVARLARYNYADAAAAAELPAPDADLAFRMEYPQPGGLDDIDARVATRQPPGSEQVEIRVHATGLNFIDALRALGVYPGQDDGPVQVGMECAGTVTAVGAGVDGVQVGDDVIALAPDGVGSFVTTHACLVAAKPAHLSFDAAAGIPIAFLTAYYALHEQARLRRGERVLIHSAAGGVGLAGIEVARWLDAKVYATAGTPEKRDHLRALGVDHVSDSRSLAFADEVLAATDGEGVDVVLNSLTGAAIAKGLAALRPYGRFLEIGKHDIYGHGQLRLWQLRRNASYIVIDLAQLIVDRPGYVGGLLRDIVVNIEQGTFRPLPVRTFPVAETAAAVRSLAQGKQIGKVVVSVDQRVPPAVQPAQRPIGFPVRFEARFEAEATYLITGGLGGIGGAVATWMAEQGARHLVLMGRGPASKSAHKTLDALRAAGVEVVVARGDVARAEQLAAILESTSASMPPLRGVMHAAGVLDDGILARLDERRLRDVMAPKVDGAWNLHALTRDAALDFFVLFSSAASLLGSPGLAHYAAANAFLDALAWHRRAQGRPALSINWGPWAEVGLAAAPQQLRYVTQLGIEAMPAADGIRALSHLLRAPGTQVAVLYVNWAQWRTGLRRSLNRPLLADFRHESLRGEVPSDHTGGPDGRLVSGLRRASGADRRRLLESYLRDQLASKLGLTPSRLDIRLPLSHLGVDSLIAVELRTQIERDLGVVVPVVQLLDGPSVSVLADWLDDRLPSAGPGGPDPTISADLPAEQPNGTPASTATPEATDSAGSHWMDLLAQLPEVPDDTVDELLRELLARRRYGPERPEVGAPPAALGAPPSREARRGGRRGGELGNQALAATEREHDG